MGADLSELSYHELLAEARKRGIGGADGLDRATLIETLRASDDRRGPMSMARALLGRVVRAVIPTERRSDRPAPLRSDPPRTVSEAPHRADRAGTAPPEAIPELAAAEAAKHDASAQLEARNAVLPPSAAELLGDPTFTGVRVVDEGALAIVWRIGDDRLEAAQALADGEMRLHTVRVSWPAAAPEPRITRDDHGSVRTEGAFALPPRAPGERIVASIGLAGHDGGFVSIDHATHG